MIRRNKKKNADPALQGASKLTLNDDSSFAIQEAYKALRTNLIFSLPDSRCKVIGVTSGDQGDGKSQNILNLAISFGQVGKKVLLIDCDLRLPTIAAKLGIPGTPGLSDLLVGQVGWQDIVHRSSEHNIDILPAGTTPPDATSLLGSAKMRKMLEVLKKAYDYIFLDLPPATVVTDAVILAPSLDGYLIVVREGKSTYPAVGSLLRQLELADAKILGMILTNANINGKRYYSGYYGYGKK